MENESDQEMNHMRSVGLVWILIGTHQLKKKKLLKMHRENLKTDLQFFFFKELMSIF